MADDYNTAWDSLAATIGAAKGESSGYLDDLEHLSIDQRIRVAEVAALLSIAQEISSLNPANTTHFGKDGVKRNGWGFRIE